jgi:hypothetical protein
VPLSASNARDSAFISTVAFRVPVLMHAVCLWNGVRTADVCVAAVWPPPRNIWRWYEPHSRGMQSLVLLARDMKLVLS